MTWRILITKPRKELALRDALVWLDVPAMVPTTKARRKGQLAAIVARPVAPRYTFADIADWAVLSRPEIVALDAVASVLYIDGRPAELTKQDVLILERLSEPLEAMKGSAKLALWDHIRLRVGAHAEFRAMITRFAKTGTPMAVVEILGQTTEIPVTDEVIARHGGIDRIRV